MGAFSAQLEGFRDRTIERANQIVIKAMLELRSRLIVRSPVDTGRFRNAWLYGVDTIPGAQPGLGQKSGFDRSGAERIAAIGAAIQGGQPLGHRHYIVNNLPYARALENGSSTQAPAGIVGVTVIEWSQILAEAKEATP